MSTRLLEDILHQPAALEAVGAHHQGPGLDALKRAAGLIAKGKRILLCGMGASFAACIEFSYQLGARGASVLTVEASELLYFLESQADSETVVILISRSGESVEVIKLLPRLKARQAKVVGIVNVPESTLARDSDVAITMGSPSDEMVAIQTYVATIATLALLNAELVGQLDRVRGELEHTARLLDDWIQELVRQRDEWSDFLSTSAPIYLLGRGPTSGSLAEGVLLMHEVAKSPAVGMTAAQFRHGPVEVVDQNFRAVVFGTQRTTATLDEALANDLARMEGQVRWLGPSTAGSNAIPLCSWPNAIPKRFTAVAEIVPIQVLAYKKAELRGIRPGQFRWAPLITTSEVGFAQRIGS